jgi:hypothetical protein
MVCGSGFTKVAAFDRAITVESLWHRRCGFVPAGGEILKRGEKSHANGKRHKTTEARLERCCLRGVGDDGGCDPFHFFALFFLFRFRIKFIEFPPPGYCCNPGPTAIILMGRTVDCALQRGVAVQLMY